MSNIKYISTRGNGIAVPASSAIIKGIADDGGLFVPTYLPKINIKDNKLMNADYQELAFSIMREFFPDFSDAEIRDCIIKAYDNKFDTPMIAPLTKEGDAYFLELYHGATLAFKDMALSVLPHLMLLAASKCKLDKEIVILTATSGDTGKAALEAFSNIDGIKIIVFYPEEGVSEIQKLQMVTQEGRNTHVIGIKGNFDDAQNGVKAIFSNRSFNDLLSSKNYIFSSANSINIGRLIPQIVYYFYGYYQMVKNGDVNCGEEINACVPTGNFGNILAGYYSKIMGLPIKKLICASNENKILYDFINTGIYDRNREFLTTISPSMDILISSNLERFLYMFSEDDSEIVKKLMEELKNKGRYEVANNIKEKLGVFFAGYADDSETRAAIKKMYKTSNYLIDTHTAVAYSVYNKYLSNTGDKTKTMIISTASPYKFTKDVMGAIDEGYYGYSDIGLVDQMALLQNREVPEPIREIEKRQVLHKEVCEGDEMESVITDILNL